MSSITVPKSAKDFEMNDVSVEIPKGLGQPFGYRLFVLPVKPKSKVGSILLPDEVKDANDWLNAIGKVAAVGTCAFTHPRWKELGLKAKDTPKVGDFIMYASRSPHRFTFNGVSVLVINDDWISGTVDPETAYSYKFYV